LHSFKQAGYQWLYFNLESTAKPDSSRLPLETEGFSKKRFTIAAPTAFAFFRNKRPFSSHQALSLRVELRSSSSKHPLTGEYR
jgi:hypothetical protein